jgi:hypothetical protein
LRVFPKTWLSIEDPASCAAFAVILFLYWLNDHESQDEWEYQERKGAFSARRGDRHH